MDSLSFAWPLFYFVCGVCAGVVLMVLLPPLLKSNPVDDRARAQQLMQTPDPTAERSLQGWLDVSRMVRSIGFCVAGAMVMIALLKILPVIPALVQKLMAGGTSQVHERARYPLIDVNEIVRAVQEVDINHDGEVDRCSIKLIDKLGDGDAMNEAQPLLQVLRVFDGQPCTTITRNAMVAATQPLVKFDQRPLFVVTIWREGDKVIVTLRKAGDRE
jgi:hypothetical protein